MTDKRSDPGSSNGAAGYLGTILLLVIIVMFTMAVVRPDLCSAILASLGGY